MIINSSYIRTSKQLNLSNSINTKPQSRPLDGVQAALQSWLQVEVQRTDTFDSSRQTLWNNLSQSTQVIFDLILGSQICNLMFSKISNEMVTTHGYSLNQINVWNTTSNWEENSINKIATLTGHTYRVLYLANSPNG